MDEMKYLFSQHPVDMDEMNIGWALHIHNQSRATELQLSFALMRSRPDVAMLMVKRQFLTSITKLNYDNEYATYKINLQNSDQVSYVLILNKYFKLLHEPLFRFLLHAQVCNIVF